MGTCNCLSALDIVLLLGSIGFSMVICGALGYFRGRHDIEQQLRRISAPMKI